MSLLHHRAPGTELGGQRPGAHDDPTTLPYEANGGKPEGLDFGGQRLPDDYDQIVARRSRRRKIGAYVGLGALAAGGILYGVLRGGSAASGNTAHGKAAATAGPKAGAPAPANTSGSTPSNGNASLSQVLVGDLRNPCNVVTGANIAAALEVDASGLGACEPSEAANVDRANHIVDGQWSYGQGYPQIEISVQPGANFPLGDSRYKTEILTTADGHRFLAESAGGDEAVLDVQVGSYDFDMVYINSAGGGIPGDIVQRLGVLAGQAIPEIMAGA